MNQSFLFFELLSIFIEHWLFLSLKFISFRTVRGGKYLATQRSSCFKISPDETVIDDVINNCDVCAQFGRAPHKPVVSLLLSSSWNNTVAMDLHQMTHPLGFCTSSMYLQDSMSQFLSMTRRLTPLLRPLLSTGACNLGSLP